MKSLNRALTSIPYPLWWGVVLVVLFVVVRRFASSLGGLFGIGQPDGERRERENNEVEKVARDTGLNPETLKGDAHALGHAYGTIYAWHDWRRWTEDEDSAVTIILQYSRRDVGALVEAYSVITSGRSLRGDSMAYLSTDEWRSVSHLL